MGLYINQKNQRSELQERVVAQMQERIKTAQLEDNPPPMPDGLPYDHSDQHATRMPGVIITVLLLVLIVAVVWWASTR